MKPYHYPNPRHIYCGVGVAKKIGEIVVNENLSKVVICTDSFLATHGMLDNVVKSLEEAGIEYKVFSDVRPNPLLSNVLACNALMKEFGAEGVVSVGGGSSIDCGKAAAFMMTNPEPIEQYYGVGKVKFDPVPIFSIPTTAGTGSEVTTGGIYVNDKTGMKGGIISDRVMSTAAIIDPEMVATLPPNQTAATGMDALAHAIEAYTNVNVAPQSEIWCRESVRLIGKYLRIAYSQPDNMEARLGMSQAAAYAGIALNGSGCAGNHAMAYPLENKYHVPHGFANASMLPAVIKFNGPACMEKYAEIARLLGENIDGLSMREASLKAGEAIKALCEDINIPKLRDYGMTEEDIEPFAEECCANDRLMPQNPRKIDVKDAIKIYKEVL